MKHLNFKLFKTLFFAILLFAVSANKSSAQIYQHNFGTANITAYPYTVAPNSIDTNLSGSLWTNSAGNWTSDSGSSGEALRFLNNGTITLSFTVNPNNQASISSYSFWARRSGTGANAYTLKINGTTVGNGNIPSGGGSVIGPVAVSTPVIGLTGTVTVEIVLSGSTNAQGTFRLDDFTLNGAVTPTCTPAVITSVSSTSAPAGSIITIIGSGFLSGSGTTGISFNGVPAVGFTVVSDNTITATIPLLATTGNISVTTNNCNATGPVINILTSTCLPGGNVNDLFISEVYDAQAGENGAIEIYNGTGATVNLAGYTISRSGSIGGTITPDFFVFPSQDLLNGQTYIALKRTGTFCNFTTAVSPQLLSGFNADDELYLLKNGVIIDKVITPDNTGFTMTRNDDASVPSTVFNAAEWNISNSEDCADLGFHNINVVIPSVITTQPVSTSVCEGAQAQFNVTATNITGFTYQWKVLNASGNWVNVVNGANYSGATTNTLTVNQVPVSFNGNQYYCEISSLLCTLISNAAQLTVVPTPSEPGVQVQPITCTNPVATLTVTPPTTDPGYSYSINNGATYQNSNVFENLGQGTYQVVYKLNSGCPSLAAQVTINPAPAPLPAVTATPQNPDCTSTVSGLTITQPTGTGFIYTITLNGTNTTITQTNNPVFTGLQPGLYSIEVENTDGCTATGSVTINPAPAPLPAVTATPQNPDCTSTVSGLTITQPTGTGFIYTITLNGTNTTITQTNNPVFTGLQPGTYSIEAENTDGCTATGSVTIDAAPAPLPAVTATPQNPDCTNPIGGLTITQPTGTGFIYRVTLNGTNTTITQTNNPVFTGLQPGTYSIEAENTDGCTATGSVTINPAPAPLPAVTATPQNPDCTNPVSGLTITQPTGTGFIYTITLNGTNTTITQTNNPVFTGLQPGTYSIEVENTDGCTATGSVTIAPAPAPLPAVDAVVTNPLCGEVTGTITINAPIANDIQYSINGVDFQSARLFTNVAAGNYTITAKNTAGCSSTQNVTVLPAPGLPVLTTAQGCENTIRGNEYILTVNALDNSFNTETAVYKWSVSGGAFIIGTDNTFNVSEYAKANNITFEVPLNIEVMVTTEAGCTNKATFKVDGVFCAIPKGISPNNDGLNDNFDLTGLNITMLKIYNRYGKEVYKRANYTNQWYGDADNGDKLPTGTYYYMAEPANGPVKTGWVYINREE